MVIGTSEDKHLARKVAELCNEAGEGDGQLSFRLFWGSESLGIPLKGSWNLGSSLLKSSIATVALSLDPWNTREPARLRGLLPFRV